MKDNEIKKAFESLTPSDEARERMFNAIINKNSAADATDMNAVKKHSYKSPWYVRFKPQIGICSTAAICVVAFTLTITNPGIKNIEQNNIQMEYVDFAENDESICKNTTTAQSENNFGQLENNENSILNTKNPKLKNSSDNNNEKTTSAYKNPKDDAVFTDSSEYITKATGIVSKPIETTVSSSTFTTVKTTAIKETTTVMSTAKNPIYMNFLDFNCIIWNNNTYITNYTEIEYSDIADSLGSNTALNNNGQSYSIVLYKIKNMPIEQGFAVQYAGKSNYYVFYNMEL